jgi:hypothetical protein
MLSARQAWTLLGLLALAAFVLGSRPAYLLLAGAPDWECRPVVVSEPARTAGIHQVGYVEYVLDINDAGPPCSVG